MIKLVSFNLRMPAPQDGINYLPNRIPAITCRIQKEQPDVIGFQEMEELGLELVSKALASEYLLIGPGREKDWSGEGCRIALAKKSMMVLAFDHLWLSPSPRVAGSRFEKQSICPRVVTWCKLLHKPSGKRFYFVNTHLDHEFEEARILGLQSVFELTCQLKAEEDLPVYITGDFNFKPDEAPYELIRNSLYADLTQNLEGTFHGYGKEEPVKIDYILTDCNMGEYQASQWHECKDGVYLSDHDPVCVEWNE